MTDVPDLITVADGLRARIVYAIDANGNMPAKDYYDQLDGKHAKKIDYLFARMCSLGSIYNEEQFTKERGRIYAFKAKQPRIYCFQDGRDWALTNGVTKKQNKADPIDLDRAERIMNEYLMRKGGIYGH